MGIFPFVWYNKIMRKFDKIESSNLIFRPITAGDTDMVLKWRNSDFVREHFLYRETITRSDHEHWLKTRVETGEVRQFVIVEKSTGRSIGSVYFKDIDKAVGSAEYGIFIGEESARGLGYGNETAGAMVSYFFNDLKGERLYLRVLKDNIPAIRSYENAGFKRIEGSDLDNVQFMEIIRNDKEHS